MSIKSFLQKKGMTNEKDVDRAVKLKGFKVGLPKKNIHLNTNRLVNFLNLRRKIQGYVEEHLKEEENHWHRLLIWNCKS